MHKLLPTTPIILTALLTALIHLPTTNALPLPNPNPNPSPDYHEPYAEDPDIYPPDFDITHSIEMPHSEIPVSPWENAAPPFTQNPTPAEPATQPPEGGTPENAEASDSWLQDWDGWEAANGGEGVGEAAAADAAAAGGEAAAAAGITEAASGATLGGEILAGLETAGEVAAAAAVL